MQSSSSGLNSRFWLGNEAFLPSAAGRGSVMESQNRGLCPRQFVGKLFARNVAFREMKWQCAERDNMHSYLMTEKNPV